MFVFIALTAILGCLLILWSWNDMAAFAGWLMGQFLGRDKTDPSKGNEKRSNGDVAKLPKCDIADDQVKLSRPLHQIIEDTFNEEIKKLSTNQSPSSSVKRRTVQTLKTGNAISEQTKTIPEAETSRDTAECIATSLSQSHRVNAKPSEPALKMEPPTAPAPAKQAESPNREVIKASKEIRVLTLNHKEHQDATLYRLQKKWSLQFRLGPTLLGRKVSLFCNYPRFGEEFKRNRYYQLQWALDEGCKNVDGTALHTTLAINVAGSFHYYFTYDDCDPSDHQGSGFFLVDPVLKYGNDEDLPLDCIQCQTVLSKNLGRFSTWPSKLRVSKESGYNMIHFTPVQELGESNSAYSLREQLKLNPAFNDVGETVTIDDLAKFVEKIRKEWKVTSICDIVLNHTANESAWLVEHPEATYNCSNCPYMRPAYLLDAAFHQFGLDVKNGVYEDRGVPTEVSKEDHLNAIKHILHTDVLDKLKLQELFTCDVSNLVNKFLSMARNKVPRVMNDAQLKEELKLIQDVQYRRLASTVDLDLALRIYNVYRNDSFDEETRLRKCTEDFKAKLDALNEAVMKKLRNDLNVAVENTIAGIRYFRVQDDGPRIKEITRTAPLIYRYFTDFGRPDNVQEHEDIMYGLNGRYIMAHNGWVMDSDPLHNFASNYTVYLRRELIAWGDSVKLRYGDKPEDNPFLWKHMKEYVELTARIFDGVRLDNCHSTPIPVAEYLLDCARRIRPNLYVAAELFTNSDHKDNIFVNRLGITSLIREALNAWDSHEQGRLVYRYGGTPVGSFYQPKTRPLMPTIAHALFMDQTHDNPSPVEKRSVFDLLPSSALVAMACCASGSNRGYDELVPHHIHVVDESREYAGWSEKNSDEADIVSEYSGIVVAKRVLNDLHFRLGFEGYDQVYVDQVNSDIVAVTRHNPITHESVILVAYTAFMHPDQNRLNENIYIKPLRIEGELQKIILEATLSHKSGSKYGKSDFSKDSKYINGCTDYKLSIKTGIKLEDSFVLVKGNSGDCNVLQLDFKNFTPGSVVAVKVNLSSKVAEAVKKLRGLNIVTDNKLSEVLDGLSLVDFNRVLYRCDQEEKDDGNGFGAYDIPNFGPMVYCGLQGVISLLSSIRPNNDLGHSLCANLRDGNWLIDYTYQRLKVHEGTKEYSKWLEQNLQDLKLIPRYLIPAYFDVIVTNLYMSLIETCLNSMSDYVRNGSTFVSGLALGSVQFCAVVNSAQLPTLSPKLSPPCASNPGVSLSAGLPHFTTGYTRNWGRDTFIALRGLLLLTGRHEEARRHILAYAGCLRHGLIPNLLDGGKNSRYNCRDAVWWWLYCIQCYVREVPEGKAILKDKVSRIFPNDEAPAQEAGVIDQPLHDVMQEALTVHFQGLTFRERNAGRKIDEHMSERGFNNQIGVHPETGFVFGGNEANCGTWMDKMGSSEKAANRGKPATPRDGSAIELVGLSKSVVSWLYCLNKDKLYPHSGVERKHRNGTYTKWTFAEWADKIQKNFERCFWIDAENDKNEKRPELINKRCIYKDCYGASQAWSDYQLRCNFPVAMVVAPELFDSKHAWLALQTAEKHLLGPLGMKTLDGSDWNYCGDYDNSNDSNDPKVAHGFNYHQGPEWVWPVGFFLRAKLIFAEREGKLKQALSSTKEILSRHFVELQTSAWRGLPELTCTDGSYCKDSCRTQAWSMSCILEVLADLQKIESRDPTISTN